VLLLVDFVLSAYFLHLKGTRINSCIPTWHTHYQNAFFVNFNCSFVCDIHVQLTPWRQNSKVHHRTHNSPPTVPTLSQVNPLHTPPTNLPKVHFIPSFHLRLGLPSGLFPSGFPTKTPYTFLPSPMRATCPAHLIYFDLICLTISGDEYK
jgi:hypothetical protein